jgi:hypothetical protein
MLVWEDNNNIGNEDLLQSAMQTRHCTNLQDVQKQFREILDANATLFFQGHVTASFSFGLNAQFTINRGVGELENEANTPKTPEKKDVLPSVGSNAGLKRGWNNSETIPASAALTEANSSERIKVQRAVSNAVVDAIAETDGFAYILWSPWEAEADDVRFKYACRDSHQNKERNASSKRVVDEKDSSSSGSGKILVLIFFFFLSVLM